MSQDVLRPFLEKLESLWPRYVDQVVSFRLRPLIGTETVMRVSGGPAYTVMFTAEKMSFRQEESERPDAVVEMSESDWSDVISGKVGIMSVVIAGRCAYPKHQRYVISKLSIVLQSLATMMGGAGS